MKFDWFLAKYMNFYFYSSYEIPKDQVIDWDIPLVEAHNLSLRDR